MNIPLDPWYVTPIVIKHGRDFGYVIYVTTVPVVRETKQGILRILRSALERRVTVKKS